MLHTEHGRASSLSIRKLLQFVRRVDKLKEFRFSIVSISRSFSMTTRRDLLKTTAALGTAAFFGSQFGSLALADSAQESTAQLDPNTIYSTMLGWHIGPQIYSFKNFPFEEAIKKVCQTGSKSFELFQNQRLLKDKDIKVHAGMSKDEIKILKSLIADSGCVPHAMGVCGTNRKDFDFAAELGFAQINSEPKFDTIEEVNKLAEEYRINVGLHNHPKASIYWDPDIVLEQLKNCGSRVGACCDTGHWIRSGLDPVECIKKLAGKIVSFHIKDLNEGKRDVPLGQGVCKIEEVMREVATQKMRGPFSIEYEADWDNNVGFVTEGIKFFNETAKKIVLGQ